MIDIQEKDKCTGCTACASECPKKCITMVEDSEGFKYPKVDTEECIHCNLCDKVCPFNECNLPMESIEEAYVVRAKEEEYLMNGTSGGFVGPLIEFVLENSGVCCAATMDENMDVRHVIIDTEIEWQNQRENIQGSKYVQSELSYCFRRIKKYLELKKTVLFIGTPCQVNGLKNYIGNKDIASTLILVDIVCHGVPSHVFWDAYKNYQENRFNSKIVKAQFRKKTYGYNGSTMSLRFANKKEYNGFLRTDIMLKAYYGNIATRQSCFSCPAKGDRRSSDFTIFDSWHAKQMVSEAKDDNKGYTNIVIHSNAGLSVWDNIKDRYSYYKIEKEEAIKNDGIMYSGNSKPNSCRDEFYKELKKCGIQEAMAKLMPVTLMDRFRIVIKRILLIGKRVGRRSGQFKKV